MVSPAKPTSNLLWSVLNSVSFSVKILTNAVIINCEIQIFKGIELVAFKKWQSVYMQRHCAIWYFVFLNVMRQKNCIRANTIHRVWNVHQIQWFFGRINNNLKLPLYQAKYVILILYHSSLPTILTNDFVLI